MVSVTADPQGLAPGQYYGTVEVDAPSAGNSPKSVTVSLTVLDPGQSPEPEAAPSGLILVGQVGSATAAAQTITLLNHSDAILTYTSTAVTEDGQPWLTAVPASGSVPANGAIQLNVQASLAGLSAGLWRGTVRVAFSDGTVATVGVVLVATGSANNGSNTGIQSAAPPGGVR